MKSEHTLYRKMLKTGYANKEYFQCIYDQVSFLGLMVVNPLKLTNDANELLHWYVSRGYLELTKTETFSGGLLYYYRKAREW